MLATEDLWLGRFSSTGNGTRACDFSNKERKIARDMKAACKEEINDSEEKWGVTQSIPEAAKCRKEE